MRYTWLIIWIKSQGSIGFVSEQSRCSIMLPWWVVVDAEPVAAQTPPALRILRTAVNNYARVSQRCGQLLIPDIPPGATV